MLDIEPLSATDSQPDNTQSQSSFSPPNFQPSNFDKNQRYIFNRRILLLVSGCVLGYIIGRQPRKIEGVDLPPPDSVIEELRRKNILADRNANASTYLVKKINNFQHDGAGVVICLCFSGPRHR